MVVKEGVCIWAICGARVGNYKKGWQNIELCECGCVDGSDKMVHCSCGYVCVCFGYTWGG